MNTLARKGKAAAEAFKIGAPHCVYSNRITQVPTTYWKATLIFFLFILILFEREGEQTFF